jgi:deazaflavin-dependent oxidoreductase (nitroreductase family)
MKSGAMPDFLEPKPVEKALNRVLGFLVGLGIGPNYIYLLQVRGRKSGRMYATPVNVLDVGEKRYLIAPRGRTQWVRNAEAAGEITLKRGSNIANFRLLAIPDGQKAELLKLYLERYAAAVQRYFTVKAGSGVEAFQQVETKYPVFELVAN